MESSSSDNDAFMKVDDAELLEEYDASEWHDEHAREDTSKLGNTWGSMLCSSCRNVFSGEKEALKFYKHFYYLSTLRITANRGCHLCKMVRNKVDRETSNHRPSEVLRLTFQLYPSSIADEATAFELWFHYLRVAKSPEYGNVVWRIKTIDFLPTESKLPVVKSVPFK